MKNELYKFSNEIVFRGHPDKVCDQISAAILQQAIRQDRRTRAGIEVMGGKGDIFVTGEITTTANLDIERIVKEQLSAIGYDAEAYHVIDNLGRQSADIALGVDTGGAGDQGVMFGYATDETPEMLPLAQVILQDLAKIYDVLCRKERGKGFLPDGKAQITGLYDQNGHLVGIDRFVVSYQNGETNRRHTDEALAEYIHIICEERRISLWNILFNPTGRFEKGGFDADAGLTGRKIVVDAYQGFARVGGGCMNGKDPTKVDFSAAHKARQIACEIVRDGCHWAEVQLSYAIGCDKPFAVYVNTDKGMYDMTQKYAKDCTPRAMIEDLHLLDSDFTELAKFGHFTGAM